MNSPFVRWLLDVDVIPPDAEGLQLGFERPMAGWVWALVIVVVALFAFWSYSRLIGDRRGRGLLAMARFGIIVLVIAIISGPALELPQEHTEEDWVLVLVDRSESMKIADGGTAPKRDRRDEQLADLIEQQRGMWETLDEDRHVVWLGFHAGAFDLETTTETVQPTEGVVSPREPLVTLGEPTGWRTLMATSIEQAMQRAAARPLSGIVVLSDGRTTDPPSRPLLKRLAAEAAPVFVVPLGSEEPLGDIAIRRVDSPRRAFVRDKVPVVVELDQAGTAIRDATVRLIDTATGDELDRRAISGDAEEKVTLMAEPRLPGEVTWQVVIDSAGDDLIPDNNLKPFSIELIDRPLRVLYVEGYPRWEYRFFKNLLVREKSIDSSVMLLSADRDFAQEGNAPITRLPRSAEEFGEFDVIVLGDVPATFFTPQQRELIRDQVAERGTGLLWIGGERATPTSYAGTVLADLLPIRGSLALRPVDAAVNMVPTPLAERLGVLRIVTGEEDTWPAALADPATGWSQLWWAQRIEHNQLKPTAEPLAETVRSFNGMPLPLVVHMRYGSGQTIYVATDEIWRWRYGRGELLPEQFWVQMVRMLGRESISGGDDAAVIDIDPRRVAFGQPVRIAVTLRDARLAAMAPERIGAIIETADGELVAEIELRRGSEGDDLYAVTWIPDQAGTMRVRITDPALAGLRLEDEIDVFRPDDELRRPETDHPLLESLAVQTGGRVLRPDQLDELPASLPNRSVTTVSIISERIWNTPLAFGLILLLLTLEWVGRKLVRLV